MTSWYDDKAADINKSLGLKPKQSENKNQINDDKTLTIKVPVIKPKHKEVKKNYTFTLKESTRNHLREVSAKQGYTSSEYLELLIKQL